MDFSYPEQNTQFTSNYSVDWAFEVYKMKKAILKGVKYAINPKVLPILTKQANQAFLLAMVLSRPEIVQYFLQNKLININQSIFKSQYWPSYFLLACTCSDEIFNLFKPYKIKYNIGWNGITPFLISAYKSRSLPKNGYLDFITYKQYEMLQRFRHIQLKDSFDQLPLFPLDFACMNKDRTLIKEILETVPEAGSLSRLSFIVQNEENLFLILSRYDFKEEQAFNGETPLHYSCYSGDMCALSLLLNLGFPILQNYDLKWPHEIASEKTKEKATVFFNLCTVDAPRTTSTIKKVFNKVNFEEKMMQWMEVLKFNPKDYEKYCGIFRYIKFNRNHKILTNSRFNIVNLFTLSKTPVEVEQFIKKLTHYPFYEKIYPREKGKELYENFFK
ncbi:hypothetical protein GINT2_000087 [Glugoides intestinalis]